MGRGIQLKRVFALGHHVRAGAQRILFLAHDPHKEKARREPGFNFTGRDRINTWQLPDHLVCSLRQAGQCLARDYRGSR
jgi:hypothetical protein